MARVAEPSWNAEHERAVRLIENGDFRSALVVLQELAHEDPSGWSHALAAIACFRLEDYAAAVAHCDEALERNPDRQEWRQLRAHARANAAAQINLFVPERRFFDRDELLAPPVPPPGTLSPITPARNALGSGGCSLCSATGSALFQASRSASSPESMARSRATKMKCGRTGTGGRAGARS